LYQILQFHLEQNLQQLSGKINEKNNGKTHLGISKVFIQMSELLNEVVVFFKLP
jgi:hypothetical protein